MELDEMKELWASRERKLERSLRLNERLLREVTRAQARSALTPFLRKKRFEVAGGVLLAILLGAFLVLHVGEPRFFLSAALLNALVIGLSLSSGHQLVRAGELDYSGPVTALQRDLERIKLVEYRSLKWVLLASCLLWLPLAVVLSKALLGVDLLGNVEHLWVVANVLLGALVLAVGLPLSRRYVEREGASRWARRLVEHASGRRLEAVTEFLKDLSSFEREGR